MYLTKILKKYKKCCLEFIFYYSTLIPDFTAEFEGRKMCRETGIGQWTRNYSSLYFPTTNFHYYHVLYLIL